MTKDRIAALENLGFCWDAQQESWDEQFEALVAYVRKHGHAKVAKRERSLGRWVCSQRTRVSQGKMTLERFVRLEAIGFVWASQTPTQNFIIQIEKMREKAMKKLQSDPEARKRFAELQANVSRDVTKKDNMGLDNIQKIAWGSVLSRPAHPNASTSAMSPSTSPAASAPRLASATASPTHAESELVMDPVPKEPPGASPVKAFEHASTQANVSTESVSSASTPIFGTAVAPKRTMPKPRPAEPQAQAAAALAPPDADPGVPYVALSMKTAASKMEATAQKADLVSKDMLRAKAAALRAAAEEIEAIANSSSEPSSSDAKDAKFAEV